MIRKLVLPALLVVGMNANAEESYYQNEWDSKGLIGIELGYMGTEMKYDTGSTDINGDPIFDEKTVSTGSIGLKFGAETKHYRFFLEGKYWNADEYNDALAVGGALQYLIRLDEMFNIFLGINGGTVNTTDNEWDPYGGVDAGVNLDLATNFGIELGARYDAVGSGSNEDKKLKDFYQAYISAIFKFTGDY